MYESFEDDKRYYIVTEICKRFGWGVVDTGGIASSRLLEPLAILWICQGAKSDNYDHAFRLLRK